MNKSRLAILTGILFITAHPMAVAEGILIRNVSVWNGTSEQAVPGQDVLIEGNIITAIDEGLEAGAEVQVIDGGNRVLMPGIIEAHTHLSIPISPEESYDQDPAYVAALSLEVAHMLLMRGWTTVRDAGGPSQGIARAIDEGHAIGPRIYPSASFVSQTSGHGDFRKPNDPHPNMGGNTDALKARHSLLADGPAEVRRAVRESLKQGAVQIKLMAGGGISSQHDPLDTVQYSLEELKAAVESAADWHTYVMVHAYTDEAVNRALDAGVKVIEHGHLLTRPTLKRIQSEGAYLSSQSFGFVRAIDLDLTTDRGRKAQTVMNGIDEMMNTANEIGLPVAFGTDAFGSMRIFKAAIREFSYRQRWFSSLQILRQATSINAKLLELTGPRNPYKDGPLGVIKPGAYADLLIVEGDPLADAALLEDHENNIRVIMKDGVVYKNSLTTQ